MLLFAAEGGSSLDVISIAVGVCGGLALFLFGIDMMSTALKLIAGHGLKKLLQRVTTNRFTGALAGAVVTAVIQSSSVTTVLVVGFVSAGLMNLTQSIGVIMGANVGTTITAQIIAFKITKYSLVLVAVGFAATFLFSNDKIRQYGHTIMGLGLVLFGMQLMSDGTSPLRTYEPFIELMRQMDNPLMGILFGALVTALVQSSSATTGIVIVLASQGFITLDAGIALIFGANVGTCVTAMLACIGKSVEAVRAAVSHVVFNVAGVALWFFFIPYLADGVILISPHAAEGLDAQEKLAAETPRQIANAHTIFNISNTFILIWFVVPIAKFVTWVVPKRPEKIPEDAKAIYLDELLLPTPSLALACARQEIGRLGQQSLAMVRSALRTSLKGSVGELQLLQESDSNLDRLHETIVVYLRKLSKENLSERDSSELQDFLSVANNVESIGDMIETNLVAVGIEREKVGLTIGTKTESILADLHREVCWAVENAVDAFSREDQELAQQVIDAKMRISELAARAEAHLSSRLKADDPNRLAAFRLESEIMEYMRRMYYFAKRIAKTTALKRFDGRDELETTSDDVNDSVSEIEQVESPN